MTELPNVQYTHEAGDKKDHKVTVYALSTCGFCRRGLAFLRDNKIEFDFVYVDQIPYEIKNQIKDALTEKYNERVAFPFVVLDDRECMVGFNEEKWKEKFKV
jgi:glutaredoxin-like protein NrdH